MDGQVNVDRLAESVPCLCGESKISNRVVRARAPMTGDVFEYVQCAQCETERCSPRPVRSDIGRFYSTSYPAYSVRATTFSTRLQRLAHRVLWDEQKQFGPLRPALRVLLAPLRGRSVLSFQAKGVHRVFEFGAAAGNDLATFKAAGWEVDGCEPSAHACAVAASRGIRLQNCMAEEAVLAAAQFGCVQLNSVFEHLHDPIKVLGNIHTALEQDGVLVMIVPNHAGWPGRVFGAAWVGYDAPIHLWGFTPGSLSALLERNGFRVEHIYHQMLGPWAWSVLLSGRHAVPPIAAWRQRWARVLSYPLCLFGALGALFGRGDHIKVVARRVRGAGRPVPGQA